MVEEIIVYRRRGATEVSPSLSTSHNHSSLKRKAAKKHRCNELDECTRKSQEFLSDPMLGVQVQGVVKGSSKQKQGIKTQKKTVAYDELLQPELVDVDLTVEASHRAEKVPFVRLTSESYGKPILGYPLEIEEITDGSETLLPSKECVARKIFGDKRNSVHQLVWRTSKRTPVCYVTNSLSTQASGNVEDSTLPATQNGEKSLVRTLKNLNQFNQGKTASTQTCVPVDLIFSKISSGTILGQHI